MKQFVVRIQHTSGRYHHVWWAHCPRTPLAVFFRGREEATAMSEKDAELAVKNIESAEREFGRESRVSIEKV